MSRGPPGEADRERRRRANQQPWAHLLVLPHSHLEPHSLTPTWSPGLVSTPGGQRAPNPEHSAPCLQDPPGVPGRRQHPLSTHTRVPPARLRPARSPGWCSRRRWAASNAALRASPAQPPPPPRRSPSPRLPSPPRGPGPVRPGPLGHCSDAADRAQRLGVQPAAAERPPSTMAVQASPAQSGRAAHSAASETPLERLQFGDNSGFWFPLYLKAGWAGLPRLCSASHPGCCMGSEQSPSASGSRRARAGRAAGRAARGHSLRLALPSCRLARPPSR